MSNYQIDNVATTVILGDCAVELKSLEGNSIDLIVAVKSGPNWCNSGQVKKMSSDFATAKRTLRTSSSNVKSIIAVNGCCYGKDRNPDKGDYFKYCGQSFWNFISGDENLFLQIIQPLGNKAKERNDVFLESCSKMINIFTQEFAKDFCTKAGEINWNKLVIFNSGQ
jgi:hypothetical protein